MLQSRRASYLRPLMEDMLRFRTWLMVALAMALPLLAACRVELQGVSTLIVANFTREPVTVHVSRQLDGAWSQPRDLGSVAAGSRKGVLSIPTSQQGDTEYRIEARREDGTARCRWSMTLAEIAQRDYTLYVDDVCGDTAKLTPQGSG